MPAGGRDGRRPGRHPERLARYQLLQPETGRLKCFLRETAKARNLPLADLTAAMGRRAGGL